MHPGMEDLQSKFNMFYMLRGMKFRKLSAELGLHQGQAPLLNYIVQHPGCTQKEIADRMMTSPASVAISTKRMQKAGLLEKQADENNLRCNMLYLTKQGREVSENCEKELRAFEKRIIEGVSQEDIDATERVLDKIIENICRSEDVVPEHMCSGKGCE